MGSPRRAAACSRSCSPETARYGAQGMPRAENSSFSLRRSRATRSTSGAGCRRPSRMPSRSWGISSRSQVIAATSGSARCASSIAFWAGSIRAPNRPAGALGSASTKTKSIPNRTPAAASIKPSWPPPRQAIFMVTRYLPVARGPHPERPGPARVARSRASMPIGDRPGPGSVLHARQR